MRNKKDIIYYVILGLIVIGMVLWEIYKPKPVDWSMYLENNKKTPYGTYALYESLPDLFPASEIKVQDRTIYEQSYHDFPFESNFIFISQDFKSSEEDAKTLLNYADEGNHIFIASKYFTDFLELELGLKIKGSFAFSDSSALNFSNKKLKSDSAYYINRLLGLAHFDMTDAEPKEEFKILSTNAAGQPIFIKRKWGEGAFYLHLYPEAFTNYNIVAQEQSEYAYKCLSYLPDNDIIWDEYYKPFQAEEYSHMKYVLKNPGLRRAYQIALALLLIYSLFTAKRRQRIIPVIKPPKNTSLEFAETIGRLYYHSSNHKDIALKKFNYWLEHIRQYYYLSNDEIKPDNTKNIAAKTGAKEDTIKKILQQKNIIEQVSRINEKTLSHFNDLIENYYEQEK